MIRFFTVRLTSIALILLFLSVTALQAQQFNSDSWLSKKWGTITLIPTVGQRNTMLMNTYSLFPKWEFTMAAYLYNKDKNTATNDGYSTSLYVKYMFYENKDATGGAAVKFGTGMFPGTLNKELQLEDAFRTYWTNFPVTFPFFENRLQVDVMPGASITVNYGEQHEAVGAFTYSSRAAWYPFDLYNSLVGEIYGTTGKTGSVPEFKIGWRWEPSQYAVLALTYGHEMGGSGGAGFELGLMLFTPPFACIGGCQVKKKTPTN
jgi:hypothetical protein